MVISTALTGARIVARWVSGGDVRGTWDILSSCLGTIVICTCSAFHDDVPHTRPENRRRVFALLELGRYMPVFLLLPEVLPSVAFEQLRCAYIIFVNVKHVKKSDWTFTHSFYAAAGGYAFDVQFSEDRKFRYHLTTQGFLILIEQDSRLLPDISAEAIESRSQLSTLTKAIAVLQVLSFCVTCVLRRLEGLTLSILEVSTTGYAFCAVMAYAMWWRKPCIKAEPSLVEIDRHSPVYARLYDTPGSISEERQLREGVKLGGLEQGERTLMDNVESINEGHTEGGEYRSSLPFSAEWGRGLQLFVWSAISLIHGVFYVLAWNTQLPTEIDRTIWKVCTGVVIGVGPFMAHSLDVLWRNGYTPLISLGLQKRSIQRIYKTLLFVFVFTRLCMVVETIRELLYLSPEAFILASWSAYLPQFS